MEKTLTIDGKEVRFKSTAATALRYKAQFRKDYLTDIIKLSSLEKLGNLNRDSVTSDDLEGIDFEVMYNIAWVLAKTADPNISDPITWLDGFEEFPLMDIIPELTEMVTASIGTKKK
ncbi:hypothetical protein BTO30_12475 [Domibacillus antri]|uniref:Phage tail protein n=1 Tax=Domibacillus antri TaxID=1714264 RepID=A0A1Q8Q3K7_9BACI|nr:hypothetical protein [Domibacillus antri]OLN21907.1 hypothetical protein BTO30_12475 [Domibacillus antri]